VAGADHDTSPLERVVARVRDLAASYEPPRFEHVPGPDAALFLSAIDHRTGYRGRYLVGGRGPFEGSALLWELGCLAEHRHPGTLSATRLADLDGEALADLFKIGGETVAGPDERARLLRDLAEGIVREHGGRVEALLAASGGRLGGAGGLLARLSQYEAFSDPLQKKSFLFAKIAERRGWLVVSDPESWEVCADNVLMRLALRAGLVPPGPLEEVRAATRAAFKAVAAQAGVSPPVLDDFLWELGRDDPDLLGREAGDIREPTRETDAVWY
jgi:hypothetical protein